MMMSRWLSSKRGSSVPVLLCIVSLMILSPSEALQSSLAPSLLLHTSPTSRMHPRSGTTVPPTRLFSTPDDDPELLEEELVFASKESFTSEADMAQAANDMAASQTSGNIELQTEISKSFLQYAMSIIMGRALPDARDGLKPVHRRILYSMHQLKLLPSTSHRKCARVVGEVLGKYHPHGDMAVYDALVRLAQDFSTNHRLIDGHGNFGSVDNDPAAAMRYTEARLTSMATSTLLHDLSESTVDYTPNFDGNEVEPSVLPARLPLLLINGSSGIAVGMATNIPPHNLREILSACAALVKARMDEKEVTDKKLFQLVPGPDFPTGASIMGTQGAHQLYKTTNGGIVMRATSHVETIARGRGSKRTAICVTELPYQVNKAALLEKMAALVNDKKIEGIADLRDESDRDGIRMVIELKKGAIVSIVLNNLYQKTALQSSFSGNFLALMPSTKETDDGDASNNNLTPQRFTLREALECFLTFRFDTIRRKSQAQLSKVMARMHIVEGLLIALAQVDQVIEIVRTSANQAESKALLMTTTKKGLGLSDKQAESVLKLQLGQLTRLNQGKLDEEQISLTSQQDELTRLLKVDDEVYKVMTTEFDEMKKAHGTDRKTKILTEDGDVDEIDMIKNSRSVIVVTRGGYIKRMPLKTFDSQGRGTRGKRGTSNADGGDSSSVDNEVLHVVTCNDHDHLLMITQNGVAFGLRAYQVPAASRTAKGTPIPSVLPISSDDGVTAVLPVSEFTSHEYIVLATEQGWIKRTPLDAFEKISNRGLTIASLAGEDKLNWCQKCTDEDDILIGTAGGIAARFDASKLRPTGRTSRGVKSINLKEGDTLADMNILSPNNSNDFVLCVSSQGYGKRIEASAFRPTARGGRGVIALKFKAATKRITDRMSCFCVVKESDEILINTAKGVMVRQSVSKIPSQGRTATGVVLQRVDGGDQITSVSLVPARQQVDQ